MTITAIFGVLAVSFVSTNQKFFIILGLLFVVLVMLSAALSGIFFGTWLDTLHKKTKDIVPSWIHVVLGSILLAIVSFVPFVGGIIVFIIFLGIFGAVVKTAYFTARGN